MFDILTLNGGLNKASLDCVGDFSYFRVLEAVFLHGVNAAVLQKWENWSKTNAIKVRISLSICFCFSFTFDLLHCLIGIDGYESIGAVGGGHILALQDILQLLAGDLNIFALILSLRGALLDLDDLFFSGAVWCMVDKRGSVCMKKRKLGICLSFWFSNR